MRSLSVEATANAYRRGHSHQPLTRAAHLIEVQQASRHHDGAEERPHSPDAAMSAHARREKLDGFRDFASILHSRMSFDTRLQLVATPEVGASTRSMPQPPLYCRQPARQALAGFI